MKHSIIYSAISVATAVAITACSSGSDVAGIGGSGFVATGTITGFGSVHVNDVKYITDPNTTKYTVEDNSSSSETALNIGMVVFVEGSIDANGTTGTATAIRYDDSLEGPVSSITAAPPATGASRSRELTILGTTVIVSDPDTAIDGSITFDTLAAGDNIEVSGFPDGNGAINATFIEEKPAFVPDQTIVEIKGIIQNSDGSSKFDIGNMTVNVTGNTDTSDLLSGLTDGTFVEVKGTLPSAASTTLDATKVEPEDDSLGDDRDEVEIEGIITRYSNDSDFDIDGYRVDASNATKKPSGLVLKENMRIEAEGAVVNEILVADEIEAESEEAKASAVVSSVDPGNNKFELTPAGTAQSVTIIVNGDTEYEDNSMINSPSFDLSEINDGNYIEVEGIEIDDGGLTTILASKVNREDSGDTKLQGIVTAGSDMSSTITVLGIGFQIGASTKFYDIDESTELTQAAFFDPANTQLGVSVIKIKDSTSAGDIGTADEVEIERR